MIGGLIARHLEGFRCDRILDVGPGYAEFSRVAAGVTGARSIMFVDCDSAVLAWQAGRCADAGIHAIIVNSLLTTEALSSIGDRFGVIHCQEVLEHLPDAEGILRSLAGLLQPGGRIIITVPTRRSERVLRVLNPSYMRGEVHGHVNEFDASALRALVSGAGLSVLVFLPAQPHYFIAHSWLTGTRMKLEASTGKVLTRGVRGFVFGNIVKYARLFFTATGLSLWSRVLPRNYFVMAGRHEDTR